MAASPSRRRRCRDRRSADVEPVGLRPRGCCRPRPALAPEVRPAPARRRAHRCSPPRRRWARGHRAAGAAARPASMPCLSRRGPGQLLAEPPLPASAPRRRSLCHAGRRARFATQSTSAESWRSARNWRGLEHRGWNLTRVAPRRRCRRRQSLPTLARARRAGRGQRRPRARARSPRYDEVFSVRALTYPCQHGVRGRDLLENHLLLQSALSLRTLRLDQPTRTPRPERPTRFRRDSR